MGSQLSIREGMILSEPSKGKLAIAHQRICACPPRHLSCVTAKEWVRGMVTIHEFHYEKRDIRATNVHPASFPIALPTHFIRLLTHQGETVLDPFVGIGSTLVAAQDLGRNAVGFDLQDKYADIAVSRLSQSRLYPVTRQVAIVDDALNAVEYLEEETVALSVTSPPYPHFLTHKRRNKSIRGDLRTNKNYLKVQQYSDHPDDLGHMDHEAYGKRLTEIYRGLLPLHRSGAHCVVNINDLWEDDRRYTTHAVVIDALTHAGFEFRNTFIWDKRPLVNRVGIYGWPSNFISLGTTMEFILDFRKPR
ncbi:MAG TPA: DNA methyltransferase [Candidatus Bathyarchaeia archaeon]